MKTTTSIDSVYIQFKSPSKFRIMHGLYNGPIELQSERIPSKNEHVNESRFFNKNYRSRTIFHSNYHRGWFKKENGKVLSSSGESLLLKFDGLNAYRRYQDQARNKALDFVFDLAKSSGADYRYKKIDIAFDIEINTRINHLFPLKLAKSSNIRSPFNYYDKNNDGSLTHYIETKTKSGKKRTIRAYLYEKHMKDGLKGRRIFRFEISICGDGIKNVGDNPDKLIKYLEKIISRYRLYYFNDINSCREFKRQYANNIRKNESPNVPQKLLREIESNSTPIPLELSGEIKRRITHSLTITETIKHETFISEAIKKINNKKVENNRISEKQRQRSRLKIRTREQNRTIDLQKIRERIEDIQQCKENQFQFDEWKFKGDLVSIKKSSVNITGPPL